MTTSVGGGVEIVEPRTGTFAVLGSLLAIAATFFIGIRPDIVTPIIDPDRDAQVILWRTAVVVIGVVVTMFFTPLMRDMFLPDGRMNRYVSPGLIVGALSVTGVSTLWLLLVAVSSTGGSLPSDAIAYIGNVTVIGILLGLALVAISWLLRTWDALSELIKYGQRSKVPLALAALALVLLFLLLVPVQNAFRG